MVWFCGTSSIANVDMQDLSFVETKNLLIDLDVDTYSIPYRCIAKDAGRTIMMAFFFDSESNILYTDPSIKDPDTYTLKEIFPSCKKIDFEIYYFFFLKKLP